MIFGSRDEDSTGFHKQQNNDLLRAGALVRHPSSLCQANSHIAWAKSPALRCANKAFAALLRRNSFTFSRPNGVALGIRAWGDITMTDTESGKERRHQVERYRVLARETTDPLASGLLRDIVSELEADLKELAEDALWSPERRPA